MFDLVMARFSGPEKALICSIRETVFIKEQGVPPELEYDECDAQAIHVLVWLNGQAVGTGRILGDGHIGRIAILAQYRGRGLGAALVGLLVNEAKRTGLNRVYLGAQIHAVGFYEKLGFVVYGDEFMDAGIPHRHMEQNLPS